MNILIVLAKSFINYDCFNLTTKAFIQPNKPKKQALKQQALKKTVAQDFNLNLNRCCLNRCW